MLLPYSLSDLTESPRCIIIVVFSVCFLSVLLFVVTSIKMKLLEFIMRNESC